MNLNKITVITGHYGSGKTNIAVNLALELKKQNKNCTLIDLDIVNPYFRSADFKDFLSRHEIKLAVSKYANSNLDIPSLSLDLNGLTALDEYVIIDVGGDDAGAVALGRYNDVLSGFAEKKQLSMLYVINAYRYLTKNPHEALDLMYEIETASKLKCTAIINNSNLGAETTAEDIENSLSYANETSAISGLPVIATTGKYEFMSNKIPNYFPVEIYVKTTWS